MTNLNNTIEDQSEAVVTRADVKGSVVRLFDGRKKVGEYAPEHILNDATLQGILAGLELPLPLGDAKDAIENAILALIAKRGSVIPDGYRHQYGVDQNCGDDVAKVLKAEVTNGDALDFDKLREVARTNGIEDRFDVWLAKDLNNGMVRMNCGNVLRGMVRRGEEVRIGTKVWEANPEA